MAEKRKRVPKAKPDERKYIMTWSQLNHNEYELDENNRFKKYPTKTAFWDKCKEYFELMSKNGRAYTISGLLLHLGLTHSSFKNYLEKYTDYRDIAEYSKLVIENWLEENAIAGNLNTILGIFLSKARHVLDDKVEKEVVKEDVVINIFESEPDDND